MPKISNIPQDELRGLINNGWTIQNIAEYYGVSRPTIYKHLKGFKITTPAERTTVINTLTSQEKWKKAYERYNYSCSNCRVSEKPFLLQWESEIPDTTEHIVTKVCQKGESRFRSLLCPICYRLNELRKGRNFDKSLMRFWREKMGARQLAEAIEEAFTH